jgi:uncharacterized phiE125 gp8 family phage protein
MSTIDLGDLLPLRIKVKDAAGALANATTVTVTVTRPDGTTSTPAVANPSTGIYDASSAFAATTQRGRHTAVWVATGANASAFTTVYHVTDPAASIIGLAAAQAFLRVFTDSDQDAVRSVVEAASEVVEAYTARTWRRRTVVETHNGAGCALVLREYPQHSITGVVENGVTLTGGDYVLDGTAGILYRGTGTSRRDWYPGVGTVVVNYEAGPAVVPEAVTDAVLQVTRVLWEQRRGGTRQSDPATALYAEQRDLIPRATRMTLDGYRLPGIA